MKRYETPQAAEVGQASELVLGEKMVPFKADNPNSTPTDWYPTASVVDDDN